MKRFTSIALFLVVLLLAVSLFGGASKYTGFEWLDVDTMSGTAADTTAWYEKFNFLPDSLHWGFIFSANQANDSVDLVINAYWCADTTDTTTWTDAQAVVASYQVDDWVCTMYVPEHQSKFFRYFRLIITGTSGKNGADTIVKSGWIWRKL